MFNSRPDITKEIILESVSQEEIFERYLGIAVDYDSMLLSPLREDDNPTCTFKWIGDKLYFRDWTEPKAKDCFDIVKLIHGCNYYKALDVVAQDFGLLDGIETPPSKRLMAKRVKEPANLQIASQPFSTYCIKYWSEQGISVPTLLKYSVTSVRAVWVRGNQIYNWSPKDLGFAYKFSDTLIKVYFPMRKGKGQIRFFNTDNTVLEGFTQLPESGNLLIITKSYKDVMALSEFLIPAVAPASESVGLNPMIMEILRARFDNIFTLMDNDGAGKRAAVRLWQAYNLPALLFPTGEPKDFTDNLKTYGQQHMLDLINSLKKKYEID